MEASHHRKRRALTPQHSASQPLVQPHYDKRPWHGCEFGLFTRYGCAGLLDTGRKKLFLAPSNVRECNFLICLKQAV